jgi:DNA-binding transcriptional LysR family regulator
VSGFSHRGVAKIERVQRIEQFDALDAVASQPDWDDLRVFLRCAELKSFRRAAQALRVHPSTVVRRIAKLEDEMGAELFKRLPEGIALTIDGHAMLDQARSVENAIFELMRARRVVAAERVTVAVSITEGLGSYWMMPQLVRFQRQNPQVLVQMRCAMESADVLRLEADMSVQLERPANSALIVVRLGRLHIYPFASKEYLTTYGTPASVAEMARHRLVNQVAPQLDEKAWGRALGMERLDQIVSISTNASTAVLYAVENGAGIGGLPTYVYALNPRIEPVDIGIKHHMDIWLAFHPSARLDPRKAYLIEWIKKIFSPARHPWFRDEFIHPRDLTRVSSFEDL